MFPGKPLYDVGNSRARYAIISGNSPVCFPVGGALSNDGNVTFDKLCKVVLFPVIHSPMFQFVKMVILNGIPSKIVQMVIELVAIVVTGVVSVRSWANKSTQNNNVDKFEFVTRLIVKPDAVIPTAFVVNLSKQKWGIKQFFSLRTFGRPRTNAPKIANFVSGIGGYSFPNFHIYATPIVDNGIVPRVR